MLHRGPNSIFFEAIIAETSYPLGIYLKLDIFPQVLNHVPYIFKQDCTIYML